MSANPKSPSKPLAATAKQAPQDSAATVGPEGQAHALVIEDFIDDSGALHIVYEKRGEGFCPVRLSPHAGIFFPRCASTFEIRQPTERHGRSIDAYGFAVIPPHTPFQVFGNTAIADSVLFFAPADLLAAAGDAYAVDIAARLSLLQSVTIITRSNWLNEIMHRYVYERAVSKNQSNLATGFLEQEIVKEIYYRLEEFKVLDKSRFDLDTMATDLRSPLLRAAMAYVDAHLFRDIGVTDIARHVGTSESTLLREFQARLKRSPAAYIVERRLEEAMILIKSQRYSMAQISDIVGYENPSAFTAAFKKRFGVTPTQVVYKDPCALADSV